MTVDAAALADLGVIPTVYSLVFPQTREAFDALRAEADLGDMYERAWTKQQDPMHHALLDTWTQWVRPIVGDGLRRLPHRYVCAGSSEAIRDSIAQHVADAHAAGRPPRLHVFAGEYEGYAAYARAYHCEVVVHDRDAYEQSLRAKVQDADRFYLSAPSSLDGMVWPGYDAFVRFVADTLPGLRVALDLCYVGCVGTGAYALSVDAPCIDTVFFSLSKVFGVYYHRIGGVLHTRPAAGLAGNVWFKNLLSIRFGVQLMQRHDVWELPRRYRAAQVAVCERLAAATGAPVTAADVLLLAHQPAGSGGPLDEAFARGTSRRRFCLTPALDAQIRGATGETE